MPTLLESFCLLTTSGVLCGILWGFVEGICKRLETITCHIRAARYVVHVDQIDHEVGILKVWDVHTSGLLAGPSGEPQSVRLLCVEHATSAPRGMAFAYWANDWGLMASGRMRRVIAQKNGSRSLGKRSDSLLHAQRATSSHNGMAFVDWANDRTLLGPTLLGPINRTQSPGSRIKRDRVTLDRLKI